MKGLQIPERFTGKLYFSFHSDPASCLYGEMSVSVHDFSDSQTRIQVGSIEVDVPFVDEGSLEKQVEQLRAFKCKIIDEASAKAGQIDEAIESLLAIEYSGDQS